MAIFVSCPECSSKLRLENDQAGGTAKCPQCQSMFQVPEASSAVTAQAAPAAMSVPSAAPAGMAAGGYAPQASLIMPERKRGAGIGIASMVLAIVGLLLIWVPFLGAILSILAFILGFVGLLADGRKGFAIAGFVISLIPVGLIVMFVLAMYGVIDTGLDLPNRMQGW